MLQRLILRNWKRGAPMILDFLRVRQDVMSRALRSRAPLPRQIVSYNRISCGTAFQRANKVRIVIGRGVEDVAPTDLPVNVPTMRAAKRSRPTAQPITATQAAGMVRGHAGGASRAHERLCTHVRLSGAIIPFIKFFAELSFKKATRPPVLPPPSTHTCPCRRTFSVSLQRGG